MKKIIYKCSMFAAVVLLATSCQKMDEPGLGDFPKDTNPPGGALKFYAAFDGTTDNGLKNAVDSIRANYPSENPFQSVDGINGKAIQGEAGKFIKYASFNDWAQSSSFTISYWVKKDGQTLNNTGGNGPEYAFSIRGTKKDNNDYHWSSSVMLVFLEGNNAAAALKVMVVNPSDPSNVESSPEDHWFEWAGGEALSGVLNNQWHHIALTYDEVSSNMKLYVDGVQNPNVKNWAGHGKMRLSTHRAAEYRVGGGPRNPDEADGAGGWLQSSLKGNIDQLRLYNTVLTAAEVNTLFTTKQ